MSRRRVAAIGLGAAGAGLGGALWWRRNPSACPYSQRFWVQAPHPVVTRERVLEALDPQPGERLLEVGPGTGYYSLAVAERLGPGRLDLLDLQQEMLDHTTRRATEAGATNVSAVCADARDVPFADGAFDGAYACVVLGEVPDQRAALAELARVVRPGGRVVIGEIVLDPHYVRLGSLVDQAGAVGLELERRLGGRLGYVARLRRAEDRDRPAAAATTGVLSQAGRRTLEAVCDTVAPAVEAPEGANAVERDFFARAAGDLGVAGQIEELMGSMTPTQVAGLSELLDALADEGFADGTLEARTEALHRLAETGPEAKLGVKVLRQLTVLLFYGLTDETGRNPNWEALGYPGPRSTPPSPQEAPKTIAVEDVSGEHATLTADVCLVGSGAGGGVIAAELQRAGRSVVVLEMGPYRNESDFDQRELPGMLDLYLGGGLLTTDDGSMAVLAGSCLGGGTTVNYQNCLRTPQSIRHEWAAAGVEGIDEHGHEEHLDAVMERIGAGTEATTQNRTHARLTAGLDALDLPWDAIARNADPAREDPIASGLGFVGDQSGAKQGALATFLQDAADTGARFVVGARAERVRVEDGRAAGVDAVVTHPDGSTTRLTVDAPTVVVAGGSVESPALLLRSGIGGPAVGRHLRLHPAGFVLGIYDEPIEGWEGQIQSSVSHAFKEVEGDWGFLVEGTYVAPALFLGLLPWVDGRRHKEASARELRHVAPFIFVARDHGEGSVTIDGEGSAVVRWSLEDEVDRRLFVRGQVELCRLHHAAGAAAVQTAHSTPTRWERGEDFDAFLREVEAADYGPNEIAVFSAHQMCSCRMGADPTDSVADGRGELHDTPGVWIGDASAFPTASGVNPMVSNMALARRTAHAILTAG